MQIASNKMAAKQQCDFDLHPVRLVPMQKDKILFHGTLLSNTVSQP